MWAGCGPTQQALCSMGHPGKTQWLQRCSFSVLSVLGSAGYLSGAGTCTQAQPWSGKFPLLLPSVGSLCQEFPRCTCRSFNLSKHSLSGLLLFSLGLAPFMALSSKSVIQGTFLCFWSVIQTERMGPDLLAPFAAHSSASFPQRLPSLAGCCSCITFPSHRLTCATRVYLML